MQKQARALGFFGLTVSAVVLGVSLAGIWLMTDSSLVFLLAIAALSLQLILNDLFWRAQKRLTESGETLLRCQLRSEALHTFRQPLLTVQALISDGMLILIWTTLIGGAIWLAWRNGISRGYISIVWICGSVLSVCWFGWVFFGRRCLADDEIIISEYACLAGGRLDRWDRPDVHLLAAEFNPYPAEQGGVLLLRIWREGPYQQLLERAIPLPQEYKEQAKAACLRLQPLVRKPVEGVRIRRVSHNKERTARRREQRLLEKVAIPHRVSQLGDFMLLFYALVLAVFAWWIVDQPAYTNPHTGYNFGEWHLMPIAVTLGCLTMVDIINNRRRNRRFLASLDNKPLLLFRLPSLWLECHLPEALNASRRELVNGGLLILIATTFTGFSLSLHNPFLFRFFLEREIALLLVLLFLVFLVFVVYRDWALRRRLGLVQLSSRGLWLFDRQYRWGNGTTQLVACHLEAAPSRSFETARLVLHLESSGELPLRLQVPLDKITTERVQELLNSGEIAVPSSN